MKTDRLSPLTHAPIQFHFRQTPADFTVSEIPLYPFSGEGEHLVATVRKKGLGTWELVEILSAHLGIRARDIGYAGLKDKHAMTVQHLSLPASAEAALARFSHPDIKILDTIRHRNKIRMGHLKGNRFFIRLKKVSPTDALKLDEALGWIAANGMPNYFGYQRFGKNGRNYEDAEAMLAGKLKIRNRRMRDFLLSAYQSHYFNLWLSRRVEIGRLFRGLDVRELVQVFAWEKRLVQNLKAQPHFFKILPGELMEHYPFGKLFFAEDTAAEALRFSQKDLSPTGPLSGKKLKRAVGLAGETEKDFIRTIPAPGGRRYGWVWPEGLRGVYKKESWHYELSFTLPKGSYATVLRETAANRPMVDPC